MERLYRVVSGAHTGKVGTLKPLVGVCYGGIYGYPIEIDGSLYTLGCDEVKELTAYEVACRNAIVNFLGSLGDLTLDEALANVELDARSYGWPRETVRELASRVRLHFAKVDRKPAGA